MSDIIARNTGGGAEEVTVDHREEVKEDMSSLGSDPQVEQEADEEDEEKSFLDTEAGAEYARRLEEAEYIRYQRHREERRAARMAAAASHAHHQRRARSSSNVLETDINSLQIRRGHSGADGVRMRRSSRPHGGDSRGKRALRRADTDFSCLPSFTVHSECQTEEQCSICMEKFKMGERMRKLPCSWISSLLH